MKGTPLEIREKEGFRNGFLRLMDSLHDEAARYIMARSRQHVSVHEFRKNIKKIRALLRLVRHEIGSEKYQEMNGLYRQVARQIAVLRDDTSQIELLESMKKKVDDTRIQAIMGKAARQVERKRKKEFDEFYRKNRHIAVRDSILSLKEKVRALDIKGEPEFFILKSLKKVHERARSAMETTEIVPKDEIYHYWRKQVKYLMYQMMVLNRAWPNYFRVYTVELNRLANLLGRLHDLNLFNRHIHEEKLIVLKPAQKEIVLKYIYRRRALLRKMIESSGEKLFTENSDDFSIRIFDLWIHSSMNDH